MIAEIWPKIETTQKEAAQIVEIIFDSVVRALRTGDKVEVRGFGSFRTRLRRARTARNPKNGVRVQVPPKRIPFFKPSREILATLNPGLSQPTAVPDLGKE